MSNLKLSRPGVKNLEIEHFQFCPYFSTCPSLISGTPTSIKMLLSKLTRIDLSPHKVKNLDVENCSLRKHLKLGKFLTTFLQ